MSLPVRGRGLKPALSCCVTLKVMSLPVRGRGLKPPGGAVFIEQQRRSPCGGAD